MLGLGDKFELVYRRKEAFNHPVGTVYTVVAGHQLGAICKTDYEEGPLLFVGVPGVSDIAIHLVHDGWQYVHPVDMKVLAYFKVLA